MNINLNYKTVSGLEVKDLRKENDCNCSLSSSYVYYGQILLNGTWLNTRWNSAGDNISGIKEWKLIHK